MAIYLPIRNLVRLNLLLSVVTGGTVFLFLHLDATQHFPIFYTGITICTIALIGFINIGILYVLGNRFGIKSKEFKRYRYLYSFIISAVLYLSFVPAYAKYANRSISLYDIDILITFLVSSALVNTLIIVSQNFILLQNEKAHADMELSRVRVAHAEAINLLLTQQIHPHFLFNALNTLKSIYRSDHDAGDVYMNHLANFLRASISIHPSGVSRLDEEMALLKDYLEMQRIRFGTALICTIDIAEDSLKRFYLPTFSLQPLLENALKHNELTEELPLTVFIYEEEGRIVVSNTLQKKKFKEVSTNKGLANLRERYRLLSSDEIFVKESRDLFSVSLKLLTDEYSDHRR